MWLAGVGCHQRMAYTRVHAKSIYLSFITFRGVVRGAGYILKEGGLQQSSRHPSVFALISPTHPTCSGYILPSQATRELCLSPSPAMHLCSGQPNSPPSSIALPFCTGNWGAQPVTLPSHYQWGSSRGFWTGTTHKSCAAPDASTSRAAVTTTAQPTGWSLAHALVCPF